MSKKNQVKKNKTLFGVKKLSSSFHSRSNEALVTLKTSFKRSAITVVSKSMMR